MYDGWNVVEVLDGSASNAILRKYTWGLDLSGLTAPGSEDRDREGAAGIHGAGGIGGLLAVEEPQAVGDPERYWFIYDGNGNVGQVIDASDSSIVAKYRYDPYGNPVFATGTYAAANPFRFSTKWLDDELIHDTTWIQSAYNATGMYYYGYRYYSPQVGRWINRDPIEEVGGSNLYGYAVNQPVGRVDPLGLLDIGSESECRKSGGMWFCENLVCACIGGSSRAKCCGKDYDQRTQCCENGEVVNKVSIWVCQRPIDTWYGDIIWIIWGHAYLCCEGPNTKCFSKGPHNKAPGPISPESVLLQSELEKPAV